MKVVEIFTSIDGEGKRSGLPTTFIRFFKCNLRCHYCDTTYGWAFEYEDCATEMTPDEITARVLELGVANITITGGEPLCQDHKELTELIDKLTEHYCIINIETNGTMMPICHDYPNVFYTMDFKTNASGMSDKMNMNAISSLTDKDVLKFVVGSVSDCEQAYNVIQEYSPCAQIYFSPVFGKIDPAEIVNFILDNELYHCYVQVQLHKIIWDPNMRGV